MGIRFHCPTGHPLHAKAELAGRSVLCPQCGAKAKVPNASSPSPTEPSGQPSEPARQDAPPAVASRATTAKTFKAAASSTGNPTWYVRPAAGGQFGPATDEMLRAWIAQRRIATDALIWRHGWDAWQPAGQALADWFEPAAPLQGETAARRAPQAPSTVRRTASSSKSSTAQRSSMAAVMEQPESSVDLSDTGLSAVAFDDADHLARRRESYRTRRRVDRRTAWLVTGLMLLSLVLAVLLVWIVAYR